MLYFNQYCIKNDIGKKCAEGGLYKHVIRGQEQRGVTHDVAKLDDVRTEHIKQTWRKRGSFI